MGKGHGLDELVELGRLGGAAFEQALEPLDDDDLSKLASKLEGAKLYQPAESVHRRRSERSPRLARPYFNWGFNLYFYQRAHDRAETLMAKASELFPDDAGIAYQRGINLSWGLGRHAQARPLLERSVALDADDATNHCGLAWCLLWLGHTERGLQHARLALGKTSNRDDEGSLAAQFYLYLFAEGEERQAALARLVELLATKTRVEDWDVSGLVRRARESHPEAARLEDLARVLGGQASILSLADWAAWQALRPDEWLLSRVARLAREVGEETVFASALGERLEAFTKQPPYRHVPFEQLYPTPEALANAMSSDEQAALLAFKALGPLQPPGVVELALDFLSARTHYFPREAGIVLRHSTDDRALEALLAALDTNAAMPIGFLARSVHPGVCARVRTVLEELEPEKLSEAGPLIGKAARAIYVLGDRRDPEAIEALLSIFAGHPYLRKEAAQALKDFDDPRVHAALDAAWADHDQSIGEIAVHASLYRDVPGAWARFEPHIAAVLAGSGTANDTAIVKHLLDKLPGGSSEAPLQVEPRFRELAVRLRKHDSLSWSAKRVLAGLPSEQLDALLAKFAEPKKEAKPRANLPQRRDYLARYQAGEFAVWTELVRQSEAVAEHPDLFAEASAVARALMKRVRQNADTLRATLSEAGATLEKESPPSPRSELARLSQVVGPLPIALEAFWGVVGSLQLQPPYVRDESPDYGDCSLEQEGIWMPGLDPLQLDEADVDYLLERFADERNGVHESLIEPFYVNLAPDYLHKQQVSGGSPYSIQLPPSAWDVVDPDLLDEGHDATLVGYLRLAFELGGFPLLEEADKPKDEIYMNYQVPFEHVEGDWGPPAKRLRERLVQNLIPF